MAPGYFRRAARWFLDQLSDTGSGITVQEIMKANKGAVRADRVSHLQSPYMGSTAGPFVMPYPSDTNGIHIMARHNVIASAIITNIRNEVWRKDPVLKPLFGAVCESCGKKFEDNLEQLRQRLEAGRRPKPRPNGAGEDGAVRQQQCPECGYTWNPTVPNPKKCPECNAVLQKQEPVEDESGGETATCDQCGGTLREPDESQKDIWEEFEHSRNTHGLIFHEVAEIATDSITAFDDGYLIHRFDYIVGPDGQIKNRTLVEILNGSPMRMRMVADERFRKGRYMQHADGRGYWTCPEHRINNIRPDGGTCPVKGCGKRLYPCEFVACDDEAHEDIGYIEGEVFHWSEYLPSEGYGHSPILACWTALCVIENVIRLANAIYQNQRPPKGILVFNTRNLPGLQSQIDMWEKKMETNPNYLAKLAVEIGKANEGRLVEWVPLTSDFNELQTLPLLKEVRERVEAIFGVSNLMMADTSSSGGLNNEGLQITVTLRTIDRRQMTWEYKIFPRILELLGITDYKLEFPPPVEEDRMAILERRRLNLELIRGVYELDGDIKIVNEEDFEFKLVGALKKPPPMLGAGSPVPNNPRNPNAGGENKEDFKGEKPRGVVTGRIPAAKGGTSVRLSHTDGEPFRKRLRGSSLIGSGRVRAY